MSKPIIGLLFKDKKVGSLGWVPLAAVLLAQAQPASTPVLRSFDRVLLLEEKAETSAGVSVATSTETAYRISFSAKGGIGRSSIACF